jgi:hypothetical protein
MFSNIQPQYFQGIHGLLYREIYGRVLNNERPRFTLSPDVRKLVTIASFTYTDDKVTGTVRGKEKA